MNMEQMYKLALDPRIYPDDRLLRIMQGQDKSLPMAIAMAAKQQRDKLGVAGKGVQAQLGAKQPTVKDQMLAKSLPPEPLDAGIGTLPAENMMGMDEKSLAAGGIIAFDEGGEIPKFSGGGNWFTDWRDSLYSDEEKAIEAVKNRGRKTDAKLPDLSEQQLERVRVGKPPGLDEVPMPSKAMEDEVYQSNLRQFNQERAAKEQADIAAAQASLQTKPAPAKVAPAPAQNAPATPTSSWLDDYKSFASQANKDNADYLAKLEGRSDKAREGLARLKRESGGEALMNFAQGLLSRPTLAQGVAAGLPGVVSASAGSRKEQREIERLADDMDLNLAKARTAAKQGDRDAQLNFLNAYNTDKYRMGVLQNERAATGIAAARLAQEPENVRSARAFAKEPDLYPYSSPGISKPSTIDINKALEEYNKNPKLAKHFGSFDLYYKSLTNQLLSDKIPGKDATVRPY